MSNKTEILKEAELVYFGIKKQMKNMGLDYCQSWWLTPLNFAFEYPIPTKVIVRRAKLLERMGYLKIDKVGTSTSQGTRFRLTDKEYKSERSEQ